ncbi:hypothetical protein FNF29_01486 [Cafeteria roenbergensis]|uniref:Uncharacterized protein n=1 Tax=Cafeteria roenbergensis TaxID=33653 RepID=A0A5A8DGS9_CAFRO|nr:hypothetical protein FNF29_01486 [Cafeteria roenbergensis]KAA0164585.1 hypothetical protein FNF28_03744 [Cafeteria roenbergensis]|eukprot:KAA0156070.1 hypothetical protein FNF29_01486 [Cafeteria roenbergensis]
MDDSNAKARRVDGCGFEARLSAAKLAVLALFAALMLLVPPGRVLDFITEAEVEAGSLKEGAHSALFKQGGGQRTAPSTVGGTMPTEAEAIDARSQGLAGPLTAPGAGLADRPLSKLGAAVEASGRDQSILFNNDHELCGDEVVPAHEAARKTLALIAITYKSPRSLAASLETWQSGGLLDLADELVLFVNAPSKRDIDLGEQYGFRVMTTTEHNGNVMAGPALAYAVGNITSDYVLFMEKDFHLTQDRQTALREMWAGVWHLARGVEVYRLRGKTDHPAEGMPDCCHPGADGKPQCPFNTNWKSAGSFAEHMNWLFIYCDPDILQNANGRVAECAKEPRSLCFTSAESNWSNNPVLFGREWFNRRLRHTALFGENAFEDNRMLEFQVMLDWLTWRPPARICASYWGIFTHIEIDQ